MADSDILRSTVGIKKPNKEVTDSDGVVVLCCVVDLCEELGAV